MDHGTSEERMKPEEEATAGRIRPFETEARDLAADAVDVAESLTATRDVVLSDDQLAWRKASLSPERLREAAAEGDDGVIEDAARNRAIDEGPYLKPRWKAIRSNPPRLNEGHLVSIVVFAVFIALMTTGGTSWTVLALPVGVACAYAAYRTYYTSRADESDVESFGLERGTEPVSVEVVLDGREPETVALWHLHREYVTTPISEELHEAATRRVLRHYDADS